MEITSVALQTVTAGSAIIFTETAVPGCRAIMHREGSGLVTLRGLTEQCRARFKVNFGANIAVSPDSTPGPISVAIAVNGEPLTTTTMIVTPAATEEYFNVARDLYIDVPCGCCTQISVRNTSIEPINVQNANLIVERVA